MGYLDRTSRVVDFILTEYGRKLYAAGRLNFTYYSFLDDGVDYDPYSTGTLSDADREAQVEALPMFEAPCIPDSRTPVGPLEPTNHLFAAAPGYTLVPFMSSPTGGSVLSSSCDQYVTGGIYTREGTSVAQIDLELEGEPEPGRHGFIVRVFSSGSNGVSELTPRQDLVGRRSYDPFLAGQVDEETSAAPPAFLSPRTVRGR